MVYFHGGGYTYGTVNSVLYDGNRLAHRGDAVVVTVNGRLNAFGFLYLAELGGPGFEDSGMAGQLDLVLALRWIHDNIAEFGGDASRVMIFGQSGGGGKCSTLMAMPPARGLVHRVICMSGQLIAGAPPRSRDRTGARRAPGTGPETRKYRCHPHHARSRRSNKPRASRGILWSGNRRTLACRTTHFGRSPRRFHSTCR